MRSILAIISCTLLLSFTEKTDVPVFSALVGAWETSMDVEGKQARVVQIITPSYFAIATFTPTEYLSTAGGTWTASDSQLNLTYEWHTQTPDKVGSVSTGDWKLRQNELQMDLDGKKAVWTRVDDGSSELAGAWRITGRKRDGEITRTMEMRPRRTFKILSGTRFQWTAYNVETREFSGMGGGTYTLKEGKYTEHIEVFSRNNDRVGASLEFNYEVQGKDWHHSGLSSSGDPIFEIWTNEDK